VGREPGRDGLGCPVTAPALTPAAWVAARWLAGQTGASLAGLDEKASMHGVWAVEGGNTLELAGQPVYTGDLAGGALLLARVLVKELAARSGRDPLEVTLELGAALDRLDPGRARP
jgi:hypothetical protein